MAFTFRVHPPRDQPCSRHAQALLSIAATTVGEPPEFRLTCLRHRSSSTFYILLFRGSCILIILRFSACPPAYFPIVSYCLRVIHRVSFDLVYSYCQLLTSQLSTFYRATRPFRWQSRRPYCYQPRFPLHLHNAQPELCTPPPLHIHT